ncbi:transporter substrate-binding domain-containing protein [Breoghania sp.]|uniref:transporter substrate-binding domain-containing protein n=1 Tax=Breoghania sp. TaxID=2065378 RepID=UPI002AA7C6E4|nr:transporter substrate-binding domain-containing protein [Breoghania sp.]
MKTCVALTLACMIALAGAPPRADAQVSTGSSSATIPAVPQDTAGAGADIEAHAGAPREHLNFVTGHNPPYATYEQTGIVDRLLIEAFRRANIGLSVRKVPPARAGSLVNSGIEDGCGPRVAEFSDHFPNLVRIEEPVATFELRAYTKLPDIADFKWDDLDSYTVGHVFGAVMLDNKVRAHAGTTVKLRNPRQTFQLLQQDRIDIAIAERWTALELMKELKLENVRSLRTPLERRRLYFFVHRDHAHLAPRIAEGLRAAKSDGTYTKIMEQSLGTQPPGF